MQESMIGRKLAHYRITAAIGSELPCPWHATMPRCCTRAQGSRAFRHRLRGMKIHGV